MDSSLERVLYGATSELVAYLPNLVAGIVLVGIGWLLGWIIKRIVVQVLSALRFDRLFRRFRWGEGLEKADVRHAVNDFIGNLAFLVVFLILLNAALEAMHLSVISDLLRNAVLFIPKILVALLILGLGWVLTTWITGTIHRALAKEAVPKATLIARFARFCLMLFVTAMALTEIDIAREIVIIGFSVTIVTMAVLAVVLTTLGGRKFVADILETLKE